MHEHEEERTCGAEDVTIITLTALARNYLKQADTELRAAVHPDEAQATALTAMARRHVMDAMYGIRETEVAVCPFEGLVSVRYHAGQQDWECPVCETEHVDDWDPDEGDPDLDRKYRLENG